MASVGTWDYRDRFSDEFGRTYFRRFGDGVVSSIGIGTYRGDLTDATDTRYQAAIETALDRGVNVVDTAINYRGQRSERVVGTALRETAVDTDGVVVATKGGFIPFDGSRPDNPERYVQENYVNTGIIDRQDLALGSHCLTPDYLADQLDRSLSNLGVATIDCYFVHNPETQLAIRSRGAVYDQLETAFELLERRRMAGDIRTYGVATWDAFRVPDDDDTYLSLPTVVSRARAAAETVGMETTGFRAIQLPFNVLMPEAFTVAAHQGSEGPVSALRFAHQAGLSVFTSASIAQGRLASGIPPDVAAVLTGDRPVHRAITFARSAPGVTCALVGTTSAEHVQENVAAGYDDPLGADTFAEIFE